MKRLLPILFLLLTGCGRFQANIFVDSQIDTYFKRFEEIYGIYPININASFVDTLEGDFIAVCRVRGDARYVQIRKDYWAVANDLGREQTVFHELGHCFLGLDHNTDKYSDGCPKSIMYPVAFGGSSCYNYYRSELLDNLWRL